jgi:hypothetical protein
MNSVVILVIFTVFAHLACKTMDRTQLQEALRLRATANQSALVRRQTNARVIASTVQKTQSTK